VRRPILRGSGQAIAQAERIVAWLRLPAVFLIALGQSVDHPNRETGAFFVMLAAFAAWSLGVLAWVYLRPAGAHFAAVTTGVDIAAISVLAVLSGGPFSNARLAFFLVPVAVAFRLGRSPRPRGSSSRRRDSWRGSASRASSSQPCWRGEPISSSGSERTASGCSRMSRTRSYASAVRSPTRSTTRRSRTCSPLATSSRTSRRRFPGTRP